MSTLGQILGLAALATFCGAWVLVASRRRKVRRDTAQRNLRRAVAQEKARTYQPERMVTR